MEFRTVRPEELETVFSIYQSVIGTPYCIWDDCYPSREQIMDDFNHNGLYALFENGELLGCVALLHANELDSLPFWQESEAAEIAKVVVRLDQRGRKLGGQLVNCACAELKQRGYKAVHLLAAVKNIPAQMTYRRSGFNFLGQCFMFGHQYIASEKIL